MSEDKPLILVVEDDVDLADMLNAYFQVQGYEVLTAYGGEQAVSICRSTRPDLMILDIRLPDIDGYEVARRLRSARRTGDMPIIFLTEKREREDRLQGLEVGGDDYITKPFDNQELRLRVRNALKRSTLNALTNPVTGLAEGVLVDERLEECVRTQTARDGEPWALLMVRLENLEPFREAYGFVASDDVQRAIGLMIHNAVRAIGGPSDFLGQISATEFILATTPASLPALEERIRARLEQSLEYFYPVKDRDQKMDSKGRMQVKIGRLQIQDGPFADLNQLKAELIRRLK